MEKHVVVVLGVGRSGTSAIARGLIALGISLGESIRSAANDNPRGFWEDRAVLSLNRILSRALNDPWIIVNLLPELQEKCREVFSAYQSHAIRVLQKRLSGANYWGFKDPRTIIFLPFWQSAFSTLNIEDQYVLSIRHPLAAANSGKKFNQQDLEKNLLMWLINIVAAFESTKNKKRVVVRYENMLQDPIRELKRMQRDLALPFSMNDEEVSTYVDQFLDPSLKHFAFSDEKLEQHADIQCAPLIADVYSLLVKVACDELLLDSPEFHASWGSIRLEFERFFPICHYVHTLSQREAQLSDRLNHAFHSIHWSITRPLQMIESKLRSWKKIKREARRLTRLENNI